MSQKRLVSYRYMTLRASTAAGTLGTGLLQTFVFARALTPERFSLFIFLGALGYMLSKNRCRKSTNSTLTMPASAMDSM